MPLRFRPRAVALCCTFAAAGALAQTSVAPVAVPVPVVPQVSEQTKIERLFKGGDAAEAFKQVDAAIEANPHDAQLRFLKGVMLAESGREAEATDLYLKLTQEYPELPEPYNNLAVLYAAAGRLDEARVALETALRNEPGYAAASENLGDVYVRLAIQSYEHAGQRGPALQHKLHLAQQLLEPLQASQPSPPHGS